MSILIAGALILAACGGGADTTTTTDGDAGGENGGDTTTTTTDVAPETTTTTAEPMEPITLEIQASQPELVNAEGQIWDIFEAENPGVTIELYGVNEDQREAYRARRAGGYVPAIETSAMPPVDVATQNMYVNLLEVDVEWLDRYTYDVRTAESELTGTTGLHSLDPRSGRYITWQYNADLMDDLGLDPRSVETQADLMELLLEGTALVEARDDIDYFWDMGWHNWIWGSNYLGMLPMAYEDGQRDRQQASWAGQITDPSEDPFRYTFEWFRDMYQAGVMPDEFWLREWETDMEASYLADKSVMMLHGPWTWDKMLAENPDARQLGFPSTPPENAGDPWIQWVSSPTVDNGYRIPIENLDTPEFDIILKAFNFWNSPTAVALRAQVVGVTMAYTLDEPLELESGQYLGIVQEFAPGGLYEDVQTPTVLPGEDLVSRYKNEGAGAFWDWQWNDIYGDVMEDKMTVDEAIEWFQAQIATDYTLP